MGECCFSLALEEQWVWKETSLIGMNCVSDNLHFLYGKHHAKKKKIMLTRKVGGKGSMHLCSNPPIQNLPLK